MDFRELTEEDKLKIRKVYASGLSKGEIQQALAREYQVTTRSIRNWARYLDISDERPDGHDAKILVYDFETSQIEFKGWWTGKQYVPASKIKTFPRIITVAWKWIGDDNVHTLTWDKDKDDKELVEKFAKVFNSADLVVGHNIKNFDNRWLRFRAAVHNVPVNPLIKVLDTMVEAKRLFRSPGYSLEFLCDAFKLAPKQKHEGISMWDKIEDLPPSESAEAMANMIEYNIQDIIANEDLFHYIRKYNSNHVIHVGAMEGEGKFSCPVCGGTNIEYIRMSTTTAGTVQRVMQCLDDGTYFKISNKEYTKNL